MDFGSAERRDPDEEGWGSAPLGPREGEGDDAFSSRGVGVGNGANDGVGTGS